MKYCTYKSSRNNIFILFIFYISSFFPHKYEHDLAIGGIINFSDGIGRQAITLIDALKDDLAIKFIPTRLSQAPHYSDISPTVASIIQKSKTGKARVAILEDLITCGPYNPYKKIGNSSIKIAYTMVESTEVCSTWVDILNNHFDAAVVPDPFLVNVYKNSGVTIPIFMLPLQMYLDEFYKLSQTSRPHYPFVFGFSGSFTERKNHMRLLNSFAQAFGSSADVQLILHGRYGDNNLIHMLENRTQELGLRNVKILKQSFSQREYLQFLASLDCYVSLSMGEGYSLTPREAIAAGIPCILSDATAHTTICHSGYACVVPAQIPIPAYYKHLNAYAGFFFDCFENDAAQALFDMYMNYYIYRELTQQARVWIQQYSLEALRPYYLSLIKPQKIILGTHNEIMVNGLITDSPQLYQKYCDVFYNAL